MTAAAIALVVPPVGSTATPADAAPDPAAAGSWSAVGDWPLVAIHAVLTGDGRVLTYGTTEAGTQTGRFTYDLWTPTDSPESGHSTLPNTTATDLFCNIQVTDPATGRIVMFGGDVWTGTITTNRGNPDIVAFDPDDDSLVALAGMHRPRWYATALTLPDGRIYVQGGSGGADRAEVWHDGASTLLPFSTGSLDWYYPRLVALADGGIFGIDMHGRMFHIDPALTSVTDLGLLDASLKNRWWTAVEFAPWQIVVFGGTTTATFVVDVRTGSPVVTPAAPMSSVRSWVNGVLLADGRVLAVGGSAVENTLTGVELAAEIWDPATDTWTRASEGAVPRLYHSTALLLPDGRVLVAGGGAPGPLVNTNAELFTPPGLDVTPRPQLPAFDDTARAMAGDTIAFQSPDPIERVRLIKTGSVTHGMNTDQRTVVLDAVSDGSVVTASLPTGGLLTPGNYLVYALDEAGAPSDGRIVRILPGERDGVVTVLSVVAASLGPAPDAALQPATRLGPVSG